MRWSKILHEQGADIPFIVVTGAIGDEIAIECMKEGASDYLSKIEWRDFQSRSPMHLKKKSYATNKEEVEKTALKRI